MNLKEKIQQLIAAGKTGDAIKGCLDSFKEKYPDLYQECLLHSARFKKLSQENRMGLIDGTQFSMQSNQINFALLSVLDQLPDEVGVEGGDKESGSSKMWNIFISYAHEDTPHMERLNTHLEPLKKSKQVAAWNDKQILPGTDWDKSIKKAFAEANLILILVSADYLGSQYCNMEMNWAFDSQKTLIPIIVEPCLWDQTALHTIQALPSGAKPVSQWTNREEAYANISTGILALISGTSG